MFPDYNAYNQYYGMNSGFNNGFNNSSFMMNNSFDFGMGGMNNCPEVITFSQAMNLMRNLILGWKEKDSFYENLVTNAPCEKTRRVINDMREDAKNNVNCLRDLYFDLTGQFVQENFNNTCMECAANEQENMTREDCNNYKDNLEKGLFDSLEAVNNSRRIMSVMPCGKPRTILMAVLTDDLKNASRFNYLIHMAG